MPPYIDRLERRQLLSAGEPDFTGYLFEPEPYFYPALVRSVKVSRTGTLFVRETAGDDSLRLVIQDGRIISPLFFGVLSQDGSHYDSRIDSAGLRPIQRVAVDAFGGDDVITVAADLPVSIRGARGDDTIAVYAADGTIEGGSGRNTVTHRTYNKFVDTLARYSTFVIVKRHTRTSERPLSDGD